MTGGRAAGTRPSQATEQNFQPLKRKMPFTSARPPFDSPNEYHFFSPAVKDRAASTEATEAIFIKTP
ncbi:hypothetical protein HPP92_023071, partial [Vanilla planifolia]